MFSQKSIHSKTFTRRPLKTYRWINSLVYLYQNSISISGQVRKSFLYKCSINFTHPDRAPKKIKQGVRKWPKWDYPPNPVNGSFSPSSLPGALQWNGNFELQFPECCTYDCTSHVPGAAVGPGTAVEASHPGDVVKLLSYLLPVFQSGWFPYWLPIGRLCVSCSCVYGRIVKHWSLRQRLPLFPWQSRVPGFSRWRMRWMANDASRGHRLLVGSGQGVSVVVILKNDFLDRVAKWALRKAERAK